MALKGRKVANRVVRHKLLVFILIMIASCLVLPRLARADTQEPTTSEESSTSSTNESQKGTARLPEIVVQERSDSLIGIADTSTEGTVGALQIEERPILRPAEVLEAMPGVTVTQHSGDGKANQYF